jgi:cystathionine beta-lyase/cystathionine gamma-synthase
MNIGSGIQPFNAWLLIRGLRTLPARLARITQTTQEVVAYLRRQPLVEEVIFPFDEAFPQYALAKQQMQGACGLLTFVIKASTVEATELFCESLRHILMAVSWGGHESLIIPGSAAVARDAFSPANKAHRMMRLYVGMEDAAYIMNDLDRGFDAIATTG